MVTPQFGAYGYVVMLMRGGTKPVPFGLFETKQAAEEWADTELTVQDDESYTVNYVRHVAG